MMYKKNKYLIDFLFAFVFLSFFSPFFILISIFLYCSNNGKIFFIQERPGLNEKIFKIIKFKTMNEKKDNQGNLLPDAYRLTKIGKLIRKLSLDEIPQLINVIKGEMSLIGPRPLLKEYLLYYTKIEKKRHIVKPGITGLAQVNGRNSLGWEERLELDIQYVEKISFFLDCKIFLKTIKNIIFRKDIVVIPSEKLKPLSYYREKNIII